ncbi:plasmid stabilization system protein [Clostridium homopropionicum DSM 5847]|uniref:Plasmid stabilization system protein n=1 Tax=Clostridium homopropionicum DSM 5847 TaxID=1121318 RepID=A0A0L6Z9K2_9CLOT|nr:type II toxin-antitoxin system RelE/ParE family toxin [Clostridium homopropionicum]KOA19645.1 plasmid stabilization system protein [Clostridium homopropionicum DSM 5847]SFF81024.1 Plasmid stabilization system protein ParE [Clostridium homopropionicum]
MSKKYRVEYLPIAEQDLTDIIEYITLDSPQSALKLLQEIDESISKHEDFPFIGINPRDTRLQRLNYRILVVNSYLVFYVAKDDYVEIRRIFHGKRKYQFLL